ncbi:transcription repressor NadR [Bacillus gobiensis]|uniref:transcription repressor NadR n=1 Tax=Bacillus gobiensis TaxID=1441095 RepID=UPI003D1C160D
MQEGVKLSGEQRREQLLDWLKEASAPITGTELAKKACVSRQIIVQDISLLKAKNEPIVATSQGYMYLHSTARVKKTYEKKIACSHLPEETEIELDMIVDFGVTVKDVIIEHPVYGDLTAAIHVSTRKEVGDFIKKVESTNASYLLELTGGIHIHTIVSDDESKLNEVENALYKAGILVKD